MTIKKIALVIALVLVGAVIYSVGMVALLESGFWQGILSSVKSSLDGAEVRAFGLYFVMGILMMGILVLIHGSADAKSQLGQTVCGSLAFFFFVCFGVLGLGSVWAIDTGLVTLIS